jgi:NTP pyrophosphatase (non-canonical NTP hydrolase)
MDLQQYITDATRTESKIPTVSIDPVLLTQVLEVQAATGRLLDQLKKNIYYTKPIKTGMWNDDVNLLVNVGGKIQSGAYLPLTSPKTIDIDPRVFHAIVGIATESAELIEAVLESLSSGTPIDRVNVLEELGDINWYQAILIDALAGNWDKILTTNIEKLRARYPEKFTAAAAIDRDIDAERVILEQGGAGV